MIIYYTIQLKCVQFSNLIKFNEKLKHMASHKVNRFSLRFYRIDLFPLKQF